MTTSRSQQKIYDVGVVGAGVMGSATAYFLAKNNPNLKIILLEQFDFLHRKGSSHGDSRIIRMTYPQEHYTQLMITDAYPLWAQIEKESGGTQIFTRTGGLDFGREKNPELQKLLHVATKYGVGVEVLSPTEVCQRFPLISIPDGWVAVYSPSSGILNATKAVAVLQALASKAGCRLKDNAKVVKVVWDTFCYEVVTAQETFRARKLVFTTGPWTKKLLRDQLGPRVDLPLKVEQTTIAYWKVDTALSAKYHSSSFPVFINYEEPLIYGTPAQEFPGLIKAAVHHGKVVDPDGRDFEPGLIALNEKVAPFLQSFFKGVNPTPVRTESCLYTWTPDMDFVIDEIPGHNGRLFVGCGFSGHGFKLAPVVGKMLSEMVIKGKGSPTFSSRMVKNFSIERLTSSSTSSKL